ncbi:MAG: universal stress protein [Dissulfurimicrobium sp.]|uniref:universal stress protein n=1 Tax=Dissulfurimicrobium sp. TaxID=2022436 RepID=UPI003D0FC609
MVEVKKILFPVDFTENSKKVLPYVKHFARAFAAHITLIHVVRGPDEFSGFELGSAWWSSFEKEVMEGSRAAMEHFMTENLQDYKDIDYMILMGDIIEEINKFAVEKGVDLIIMGTHGRKGLEKAVFGSVAEGVVKYAACPVLTINPFKIKS